MDQRGHEIGIVTCKGVPSALLVSPHLSPFYLANVPHEFSFLISRHCILRACHQNRSSRRVR